MIIDPLLLAVLMTLAGGFFLVRNIYYLRNHEALEKYILTTPKAKPWLKKFGQEKTMEFSKKYFMPGGIVISVALLLMGLLGLYWHLPRYLN